MRPVLFLDFDGVLNRHGTTERYTFPTGARFMGLDRELVGRLNSIMERVPEARIVVSSTWRTVLDVEGLRAALAGSGFRHVDRVIDRTPTWHTLPSGSIVAPYSTRGFEIQAWLDGQPEKPRAIAIVDDAEDMAHLHPHLVRTSFVDGLTEGDADAIVAMLTEARL